MESMSKVAVRDSQYEVNGQEVSANDIPLRQLDVWEDSFGSVKGLWFGKGLKKHFFFFFFFFF